MKRFSAAVGSSVFFALAPGVVAGVIPWGLTGWDAEPASILAQVLGVALIAAGRRGPAARLRALRARRGGDAGAGRTDAAPGRRRALPLIRNPMYVAVVTCVMGQALLLSREILWVYALGLMALFFAFVRGYEEPTLSRQFGSEYEAYRRAVPGWRPRLRPARLPRETS